MRVFIDVDRDDAEIILMALRVYTRQMPDSTGLLQRVSERVAVIVEQAISDADDSERGEE